MKKNCYWLLLGYSLAKLARTVGFRLLLLVIATGWATAANLTPYVNPFVGTEGGGNTFPGALYPTGLIQWSPDTKKVPGDYDYGTTNITGFSLTHFSGRGLLYLADIPFMPYLGTVTTSPATNPVMYQQNFSHANESAHPGYYSVVLDNGIKVELTASLRTGSGRFTFPASTKSTILINAGGSVKGDQSNTGVNIVGTNEVTGYATSQTAGGQQYTVYFAAEFDRPFVSYGTWNAGAVTSGSLSSTGAESGAFVTFDTTSNPSVNIRTSISYISVANARVNLLAENPTFNFDGIQTAADTAWNGILNKIQVTGTSIGDLQIFYTMLYLSFIHPNIMDDATGQYMGMDGKVHQVAAGHHQYENITGWDMYRSLIPLRAMLSSNESSDIMQSLVNWAAQGGGGALPRWEQTYRNSNGMEGDGQSIILASGYAFGATAFDTASAKGYMENDLSAQGASCDGLEPESRISEYLSLGYLPGSASQTLELAEADFALSQFAENIGDLATAEKYRALSGDWLNSFNSATGFSEPRNADGTWPTNFNPRSDAGFREGDSYQYTWLVPYNIAGLAAAMGGPTEAVSRLNSFFTELNAGPGSPYAWMGNEPCEEVPWEYDFLGDPAGTQAVVRNIQMECFSNTPGGLPGNNDGGALSSWYVFSALGMYPEVPGLGGLALGSPLFSQETINLENGKQIQITANTDSAMAPFVQSLTLNGASWQTPWIPFSTLNSGAVLNYILGTTASDWGAREVAPSFGANAGTAQKFEAESLAVAAFNGPDYRTIYSGSFSGGAGVILDSNAVGDSITFTVPNVAAGKYDVRIGAKDFNTRGIWQLSISPAGHASGPNLGAPVDEFSTDRSGVYTEYDLGTWSPVSTSDKWFKFTIVGKNVNSAGYREAIDYITLIRQP